MTKRGLDCVLIASAVIMYQVEVDDGKGSDANRSEALAISCFVYGVVPTLSRLNSSGGAQADYSHHQPPAHHCFECRSPLLNVRILYV